jgi:hypothetical protein
MAGAIVLGKAGVLPSGYVYENTPHQGEEGRPERTFETTLDENGGIKTAAKVGGGHMMDVRRLRQGRRSQDHARRVLSAMGCYYPIDDFTMSAERREGAFLVHAQYRQLR